MASSTATSSSVPTLPSTTSLQADALDFLGDALLLYRYRSGDSNMRSVWICSRNDAVGNIAVGNIAIALIMGVLSLSGAWQIIRHAQHDLAVSTASRLDIALLRD